MPLTKVCKASEKWACTKSADSVGANNQVQAETKGNVPRRDMKESLQWRASDVESNLKNNIVHGNHAIQRGDASMLGNEESFRQRYVAQ
jgi:hypothetical protein